MKNCRECGRPDADVVFQPNRRVCNPCRAEYSRKYYYANREACIAQRQEHYQRNREAILAWKADYYRRNPEKKWDADLKRRYGLTRAEWDEMLESQRGRCLICREQPDRRLVVDHCHETGLVRGLLCSSCNTGLGYFREHPEYLAAAIRYLAP